LTLEIGLGATKVAMSEKSRFKALRLLTRNSKVHKATKDPYGRASIEALPDELLHHIVELISPVTTVNLEFQVETCFWDYEEPTALLNLLRCSRRMWKSSSGIATDPDIS
jgi:hypothetical protein